MPKLLTMSPSSLPRGLRQAFSSQTSDRKTTAQFSSVVDILRSRHIWCQQSPFLHHRVALGTFYRPAINIRLTQEKIIKLMCRVFKEIYFHSLFKIEPWLGAAKTRMRLQLQLSDETSPLGCHRYRPSSDQKWYDAIDTVDSTPEILQPIWQTIL